MGRDWTLENTLRAHDQAVYDWLGGLAVDYGDIAGQSFPTRSILRVYATPGNAFATIAQILWRKGWLPQPTTPDEGTLQDYAWKIVPLPMASIYREAPFDTPDRAHVPVFYSRLVYNKNTGKYETHQFPGTYTINYTVDFWMTKKYTEAFLYEWLMGELGHLGAAPNETFLTVDHAEPFGKKLHGFKLMSFSDNSDLEMIDSDRRYLRFTATFSMYGLLFRKPEEGSKPVLRINTKVGDASPIDGRTHADAVELDSVNVEMDVFRDQGVPEKYLNGYFDRDGDVDVKRSLLTADGRIDIFHGRPRNNEWGAYRFALPDDASSATVGGLKLPSGGQTLVFRFAFLNPEEEAYFCITDGFGVNIQKWVLPVTKKWLRFETFAHIDGNFALCWGKDSGSASFLHVDKIRHAFAQTSGFAISPTSDSVVGGSQVVEFSGLDPKKAYVVYGTLLNTTADFDIVLSNDVASPTVVETVPISGGNWTSFGLVVQPAPSGNTVSVEGTVTDAFSSISMVEYRGSVKGRFIPYC